MSKSLVTRDRLPQRRDGTSPKPKLAEKRYISRKRNSRFIAKGKKKQKPINSGRNTNGVTWLITRQLTHTRLNL